MRLCGAAVFLAFVCPLSTPLALNASATIVFDDGGVHVIDAGNSFPFECAEVDDGPLGETTTVDVLPGGQIGTLSCAFLDAFGFSEINMLGGLIPSFRLHEDSFLFYSLCWKDFRVSPADPAPNTKCPNPARSITDSMRFPKNP